VQQQNLTLFDIRVGVARIFRGWVRGTGRIPRNNANNGQLRRSRSFKVTSFGTNGKHICDFLCVNNSINLRSILHVAEIWWIIGPTFAGAKRVPLFNAIVLAASPEFSIVKLCLQKLGTPLYRVVEGIFRIEPWRRGSRVWQTDGQTDRLWRNKCHTSLGWTAKNVDGGWDARARTRSALWWYAHDTYVGLPKFSLSKLHALPLSELSYFRSRISWLAITRTATLSVCDTVQYIREIWETRNTFCGTCICPMLLYSVHRYRNIWL